MLNLNGYLLVLDALKINTSNQNLIFGISFGE